MYKKKTALILFGSPHHDGYTSNCLNKFLNENPFKEMLIIDSYKKNVHPCIACDYCKTCDECIYKDMHDIDSALKTSDVIIFATPVYNLSFPSPMKAILDRMQRYYSKRFVRNIKPAINKKKDGIIIITCGSKDEYGIKVVKRQIELACSIINCKIIKEIVVSGTDE